MVLVDTNVWIEHFRSSSLPLTKLLLDGQVVIHELILGELSLAHFSKKRRPVILDRLNALEKIETSSHEEVSAFVEKYKLAGKGIGWIDAHLLYASRKYHLALRVS